MKPIAYAEGMSRRERINSSRKRAIAEASVRSVEEASVRSVEETKPTLKREEKGLNMKALERFRKSPAGLRFGSVTTSEDGGFSDDEFSDDEFSDDEGDD